MSKKNMLPVSLKNINCEDITYKFLFVKDLKDPTSVYLVYEVLFYAYKEGKWLYRIYSITDDNRRRSLKVWLEGYPGLQVAKGILINYLNNK